MLIILFVASACFSALGTLAGFGGGIFLIPLMVLAFQVPIEIAIGVTAISLFPSSLISSTFNLRRSAIDFRVLIALEIFTILGAFFGAHLTSLMPTRPLELCFSALLFFLSFKMLRPSPTQSFLGKFNEKINNIGPRVVDKEYSVGFFASGIFGTLSGLIAGLFGIGGGIIKTPVMIHVFRMPVRVATATAIGMIVFTSFTSGLTHYKLGHVSMELLVPCAAGFAIGAMVGSLIGVKIKDAMVQKVIGVSIFFAAVAILF